MTKLDLGHAPCAWCRRPIQQTTTAGRPRIYCGQVCRQRAYEARQRAGSLGIAPGQVVIRKQDLDRLHDRLYELEAALEDIEADLAEGRTSATLTAALDHLSEVAHRLRGFVLEPVAI